MTFKRIQVELQATVLLPMVLGKRPVQRYFLGITFGWIIHLLELRAKWLL